MRTDHHILSVGDEVRLAHVPGRWRVEIVHEHGHPDTIITCRQYKGSQSMRRSVRIFPSSEVVRVNTRRRLALDAATGGDPDRLHAIMLWEQGALTGDGEVELFRYLRDTDTLWELGKRWVKRSATLLPTLGA